jgi:hypothetical protein
MADQTRHHISRIKVFKLVLVGIALVLTLLPILRLTYFIATTGSNNPSNDEEMYVSIIEQVLSGNYQWKNLFRDSAGNLGHIVLFPLLIQIGAARFADLNIYLLLYIGIALAIARLFFLYNAFTYYIKGPLKICLLPVLSILLFSATQLSTFEFDYISLNQGLGFFGLAIGVWGLVRFSGRGLGIALMLVGGVISSWSYGGGPLLWPVFLMGMILLKFKRWTHYLFWFLGTSLASIPYFILFILRPPLHMGRPGLSAPSYSLFVQAIGMPFIEDLYVTQSAFIQEVYLKGLLGIILLLTSLLILWLNRNKATFRHLAAALMVIVFSILNILQITIFRGVLAAWYNYGFILFWVGLVGITPFLWVHKNNPAHLGFSAKLSRIAVPLYCLVLFGAMTYLIYVSNLVYENKSVFLPTRSPVSASCLRNFRTAPTYCGKNLFIFNWGVGGHELLHKLAPPLERNHLSVFAPKQRWTLQGEFILEKVKTHEVSGVPDIFWSEGLTARPGSFLDYQHLNLFLHTPDSVDWTVTLPADLKRAIFHSAVSVSRSAPYGGGSDGILFEVSLTDGDQIHPVYSQFVPPQQRDWQAFTVPLEKYAGKTITIRLGSQMMDNLIHDWAMYRYPYIELELDRKFSGDHAQKDGIHPSNTDASPSMPKTSGQDFRFEIGDAKMWEIQGMEMANSEGYWKVGQNDPQMKSKQALNICLSDYSHIYVQIKAPTAIFDSTGNDLFRQIQISMETDSQVQPLVGFSIPLIPDDELHGYTYDLKLLEMNYSTRVKGIRFDPVVSGGPPGDNQVQITDLRLIRGTEPSKCI